MNTALFKEFFMWCIIIHLGLFIWTTAMCIFARKLIHHFHGKMFGLSESAINITLYGFLGVYKVCFIFFALVPWIALTILS